MLVRRLDRDALLRNEKPQWSICRCLAGWKLTPIFSLVTPGKEPAKVLPNVQAHRPDPRPVVDTKLDGVRTCALGRFVRGNDSHFRKLDGFLPSNSAGRLKTAGVSFRHALRLVERYSI